MIDDALFARLTGYPAVSAIIGTKAFPQRGTPSVDYPLVTFMQITAGVEETRVLERGVTMFRTLQQIDIIARRRAEAITLANAVREALDGQINQTWGGLSIKAAIFDQQLDGNFENEANLHRIIQQYRITYQA